MACCQSAALGIKIQPAWCERFEVHTIGKLSAVHTAEIEVGGGKQKHDPYVCMVPGASTHFQFFFCELLGVWMK